MDRALAHQGDNEFLRAALEADALQPLDPLDLLWSGPPVDFIATRRRLVRQYSWAIPNDAALACLEQHAPIVEIGAGGGYWAYLLRKRGVDVVACDSRQYEPTKRWTTVDDRDHTIVADHPERALLLCWPTAEDWPVETLDLYQGETVIHVGEWDGCTAGETFDAQLFDHFAEIERIEIPQFVGLHDCLSVWTRRPLTEPENLGA